LEPDALSPHVVLRAAANRVLISVNPKAGARRSAALVEELAARLRERKFQVEFHTSLDQVAEAANSLHAAGELRALLGAGGDGTAAELLNRTQPGVPLAIFPRGTENLLARYLAIRPSTAEMCETISAGAAVRLDAGRANGRLFLLMASCGFDADVIQRLHANRQGNIRHWNYAKPIWQSIRRYAYPELRVSCDPPVPQAEKGISARWAFVFNLPCYAFGIPLAPAADGGDGSFDLCALGRGSTACGLWYLANVLLRRHHRLADCCTARVRRVRIESDGRVPYQLDGDPGGELPLEIEMVPARATFLAPMKQRVPVQEAAALEAARAELAPASAAG
jgi:diacylglycerol kinase family enzyme